MKKIVAIALGVIIGLSVMAKAAADLWELRDQSNVTQVTIDSAKNITGPSTLALSSGLTASSGTFTATGNGQFSITTSSGINVGGSAPVVASYFVGSGAALTGVTATSIAAGNITAGTLINSVLVPAGNLTAGPVASSILPSTVAYTSITNTWTADQTYTNVAINLSGSGGKVVSGSSITASAFFGDGTNVTNVTAAAVPATGVTAGQLAAGVTLNAGSLVNGPVASSILPSTVAYISVAQTWTATQTFKAANAGAASTFWQSSAGVNVATMTNTGVFASTLTVSGGLLNQGALSAAAIRTTSCPTSQDGIVVAGCMVFNSSDFDLYTATGSAAGQYRNTRTGVGP